MACHLVQPLCCKNVQNSYFKLKLNKVYLNYLAYKRIYCLLDSHAVVIPYAVIHLETQVTLILSEIYHSSYIVHVNHQAHANEQSI